MTKYTRVTGKVFGASADPTGTVDPTIGPTIGQFGSALDGQYVGTSDISTIQSLSAWSNGFIGCVTPNTQFPPLPEMTGFGKVLSQQICYLLQQGIAEYDSGTTYYTGNWCSYNNNLYIAKTDGFSNIAPSDPTKWDKFTGGFSRNFGEIVTSSLPIADSTLHLADGSLLSYNDYPNLIDYISSIYNKTNVPVYCWGSSPYYYYTTTIYPSSTPQNIVYDSNGYIIGYVVFGNPITHPSEIKISSLLAGGSIITATRYSSGDTSFGLTNEPFCTETDWQNFVTHRGECGYYVYDDINNTVRLPKYNSYFMNTINPDELGRSINATSPNIIGEGILQDDVSKCSGAIYSIGSVSTTNSEPGGNSSKLMGIDASRVSNVYSSYANNKIYPQSIKQLVYIVVGQ